MTDETNVAGDPRAQQALQEVEVVTTRLQTFVVAKITTPVQYQDAAAELVRIKGVKSKLEDLRFSMTRPLDAAKTAIMDFFRKPQQSLVDAETRLKAALTEYDREQERIAEEARRKAQEEADRARRFEEQRAARLAEQGATEAAQEAQQRAAVVQTPVIQAATPKAAGISYRDEYCFQVVDPDLVPREFLMVDQAKIRQRVDASKGACDIAGVRVWTEKRIAARRR